MTTDNRPVILPYARPPGPGGPTVAELYAQVVWFRRSTFGSTLVLIALACWAIASIFFAVASTQPGHQAIAVPAVLLLGIAGLALLTVCVVVLTGPVYMPKALPDGRLKTWGKANKVIAALFLLIWVAICIGRLHKHH